VIDAQMRLRFDKRNRFGRWWRDELERHVMPSRIDAGIG
jgi:hypothetical protein